MALRSLSLILLLVVLVACAALTTLSTHATPRACAWTAPRQLMVGANGWVHVENPQMVQTRGGLTFFGDNALIIATHGASAERIAGWPRGPGMLAGVIRRPNGVFEPVALPYHLRAFIAVRAVGDDSGNAHVFWGESPDTGVDQHLSVRSVWYARFDGNRWTEPERVLSDTPMLWNNTYTAIASSNGDVHLVVPAQAFAPPTHLITRFRDGRWNVRRHEWPALYTSLAVTSRGTLLLGYIGAADTGRTDVAVAVSHDRGMTWSKPMLVHRAGLSGNWGLQVVAGAGEAIYAVWEASSPTAPDRDAIVLGNEKHDSLQGAVTRDNGATWQRIPGLHVPGGVAGLQAVGAFGAVHLSFNTGDIDSAVASTAVLDGNNHWTGPTTLGLAPFWTTIAAPRGDSLRVTWDVWRAVESTRVPFTVHSSFGCSPGDG